MINLAVTNQTTPVKRLLFLFYLLIFHSTLSAQADTAGILVAYEKGMKLLERSGFHRYYARLYRSGCPKENYPKAKVMALRLHGSIMKIG